MAFIDESPSPDEVQKMEPDLLAPFILRYLQKQQPGTINRYNFSLPQHGPKYEALNHTQRETYSQCLMEAWMYLERQGFIAPQPGMQGDWAFVTRKGKAVSDEHDFETYRLGHLLPDELLDAVLLQKVRPSFITGDYDTAVFQAFKEVEVRVRKKGGFTNSEIGVKLMRAAFNPTTGVLTDKTADPGEQVARMELFAGAIGLCKNPSSHRDVETSVKEATDLIHMANHLLRILDRI